MVAGVATKSTSSLFTFSRNWSVTKWSGRTSLGGGFFKGQLHPTHFVNKFQRLRSNQTCTDVSQCWMSSNGHGRNLSSKSGNTNEDDAKAMAALDKLQFVNRLHINQISLPLDPAAAAVEDQFMPIIQFEVRCKKHRHLYNVDFKSGEKPEDFYVKVYTSKSDFLVATMQLEPKVHQPNTLALQIYAPPGKLIGSVYERAEMSRIVMVVDENDEILFQLLSDGGLGWSSVAKVLKPRGETKIGKIYRMKNQDISKNNQLAAGKTYLRFTIHFQRDLSAFRKISLIGACFILMTKFPYFPKKTIMA